MRGASEIVKPARKRAAHAAARARVRRLAVAHAGHASGPSAGVENTGSGRRDDKAAGVSSTTDLPGLG